MRTVRRVYLYAVSLISLEVVLWGLVWLARSIFCSRNTACGGTSVLATGLALVVVGIPFFGVHWFFAQRFAHQDMEERSSGLRAAFLYGVLLGTLIPVVQNVLALVNRPALMAFRLSSARSFVGGQQIWSDNLIAILMNLLAAAYIFTVLRADWKVIQPKESFANLRRIYRWFWVLYGLGLTVAGLNQLIRFVLSFNVEQLSIEFHNYWAVNGTVLALVGTPIWVFSWLTVQKSLAEQSERESFLRLGLLYLLSLVGAIVTLSTAGGVLNTLLRPVFGLGTTLNDLVKLIANPLAISLPFLGIWLYYGRWLNRAMAEVPDAPRRSGMRRLYYYILSALGLIVTFVGLALLLSFVVDTAHFGWRLNWLGNETYVNQLTAALTLLLLGLPLWLLTWRPMQAEAFSKDDAGDHARRSITRRIYLYLALFAGVIGGMVTAVILLNTLLKALFGGDTSGLLHSVLKSLEVLFLFVGLGIYHGLTLRRDGKTSASVLTGKHALFPVLIFDPGDGFGPELLAAFQKATPGLPASLQPVEQPVAGDAAPKAVVLPSDLALDPPAALRSWLEHYTGSRIVVPRPTGKWTVVGQTARLPLNQAALTIRQLAEGQELRPSGTPGWLIVVYVLAGLMGLPILFSLIAGLVSSFMP